MLLQERLRQNPLLLHEGRRQSGTGSYTNKELQSATAGGGARKLPSKAEHRDEAVFAATEKTGRNAKMNKQNKNKNPTFEAQAHSLPKTEAGLGQNGTSVLLLLSLL